MTGVADLSLRSSNFCHKSHQEIFRKHVPRPPPFFFVFFFAGKAESADEVISSSEDLPLLPDFFSHKHFMLYGEIDGKTRRLLIRYITAYDG